MLSLTNDAKTPTFDAQRIKRFNRMDAATLETVLSEDLLRSIAALPGWSAQAGRPAKGGDGAADWRIRVDGPASADLLVDCKASAFPRDIREWLWRVRQLQRTTPSPSRRPRLPVLATEHLSPGAKEMLQQEGVGYFASGGSLYLPIPGAFVLVDRPPIRRAEPERSLFTERRALVLHALLRAPQTLVGVNELAHEHELSPATVSETMTLLDKLEWTHAEGQGRDKRRRLASPGALLDAWAEHVQAHVPLRRERYFVSENKKEPLAKRLAAEFAAYRGLEYAITGEAAGQHYAPFLSHVPVVRCRFRRGLFLVPFPGARRIVAEEEFVAALGAKPASEGANFEIIESDPAELFKPIEAKQAGTPMRFATPVQVYLDLLRLPGRAKELAAHLRRETIRF